MIENDSLPCIDIGANLTSSQFDGDVENVIAESRGAGLTHVILTGSSVENSNRSVEICKRHPRYLFCTAGIHPHDAKSFEAGTTTDQLRELYPHPEVIAVGECGLDYNRNYSPHDKQRECFAAHLELATETQLPLFLHERDAHEDFLAMMTEKRDSISRGVVHCFTGTAEAAKAYLDLDLHLGITGWICDERRGVHLRELVKTIPTNRLMIETDSPYLAPRDYRPKIRRNEPKYLPHILRTIAECRGESVEELGNAIIHTTLEFFGIE